MMLQSFDGPKSTAELHLTAKTDFPKLLVTAQLTGFSSWAILWLYGNTREPEVAIAAMCFEDMTMISVLLDSNWIAYKWWFMLVTMTCLRPSCITDWDAMVKRVSWRIQVSHMVPDMSQKTLIENFYRRIEAMAGQWVSALPHNSHYHIC